MEQAIQLVPPPHFFPWPRLTPFCATPPPGDVVRVSPNELSFASARSYEDIYGFPKGGRQHFIKGDFYEIYGSAYKTGCIGSEREPATHARKKKNLAPAFTTRALSAQEHIVQQYMDVFIRKIGGLSLAGPQGLNLTKWFEMLTFDILGEMAFGESFGCLSEGTVPPPCPVRMVGASRGCAS